MTQEPKKISFGFSKLTKKPSVFTRPENEEKKVELIECLEGQTIKIKDAVEEIKGPLVIPMNETSNAIIDRIKESRRNKEKQIKVEVDDRPDSELTLDELAARELIRDAQRALNGETSRTTTKLQTLPLSDVALDGKAESTLDDYESVPITDFGMAMLRGMGWKEGMAIGKNTKAVAPPSEPELRPKGMGLGADKAVNAKNSKAVDKHGKELVLKIGAFAKITNGHHKGAYCQVEGFDEEAARVVVKTAVTKETINLNELFLMPVTKEEFVKSSKVINNAKYEEYISKKSDIKTEEVPKRIKSEIKTEIIVSSDESDGRSRSRDKKKKSKKKSKSRHRSSSSADRKSRRKNEKHHSSRSSKHKSSHKSKK